jgi:hypothetical protein
MNKQKIRLIIFATLSLFARTLTLRAATIPEFLTFDELVTLSETNRPKGPLAEKLARILTTPVMSNEASLRGATAHRPILDELGPALRVVSWNIERGLNSDLIRLAFSDPAGFKRLAGELSSFDQARSFSNGSSAKYGKAGAWRSSPTCEFPI